MAKFRMEASDAEHAAELMEEDPILVYTREDGTKKTYFASDWVMSQMDAQNGRIERGTRLAWGAFVLSVLSLVFLVVSIALR